MDQAKLERDQHGAANTLLLVTFNPVLSSLREQTANAVNKITYYVYVYTHKTIRKYTKNLVLVVFQ